MENYKFVNLRNRLLFRSFLMLSLILSASPICAQTSADFSGVWTQDITKSDDFYKDFDIQLIIKQTPLTITFKQIFFDKSGAEVTTRDFSFNLDGKEVSKEEQGGINKELATWTPDKKTLNTKSTRTVGNDVYGSTVAYSLSDNGLVLNVKTSDINPLGLSVKQTFNKKQ